MADSELCHTPSEGVAAPGGMPSQPALGVRSSDPYNSYRVPTLFWMKASGKVAARAWVARQPVQCAGMACHPSPHAGPRPTRCGSLAPLPPPGGGGDVPGLIGLCASIRVFVRLATGERRHG